MHPSSSWHHTEQRQQAADSRQTDSREREQRADRRQQIDSSWTLASAAAFDALYFFLASDSRQQSKESRQQYEASRQQYEESR
jgi:ABC-type transport system involved in Fe-S cluster assembly fused permease/ATPase subunit